MEQFKPSWVLLADESGSQPGEYWKLDRPDTSRAALRRYFKVSGFAFRALARTPRLLYLVERYQRGLLSYDACKIKELRKFCTRRHFIVKSTKRPQIIAALEVADDNQTFRLLDLPPEIRNHIYTTLFHSYPVLRRPTTPSLTQVSRQIRRETLLRFHQSCKVLVTLYIPPPSIVHILLRIPLERLDIRSSTLETFNRLAQDRLGHLKRFRLEGVVGTANLWVGTTWDVELGAYETQIQVSAGVARVKEALILDTSGFQAAKESVEKWLKAELEVVMARDGEEKFQREDVQLFHRTFMPM